MRGAPIGAKMPLTNLACQNAKCPQGKPRARLADAQGLYLEVLPNGGRYWRLKYRFDMRITMRWQPGHNLAMRLSMSPRGQPDGSGVVLPLLHLLTPIDDVSTHYFFSMGRHVALDDAELHAGMMAFVRQAFEQEDEPMIAACQEQMGTTDLLSLRPVLLTTDVATMKARRRLQALIDGEQRGGNPVVGST